MAVRAAALEGLLVGLSVWPRAPLRRTLMSLARDLDPKLAAQAVDGLARLPSARSSLLALRRGDLDPGVAQRVARRLRTLPPSPLVLLIHGRSGGVIPAEWQSLASELRQRRGAPVQLQALTAPDVAAPVAELFVPHLTLVPLFLLPGAHVRVDVPAIAAAWKRWGAVRRLPFLGAWPQWQQMLAAEVMALHQDNATSRGLTYLLHHPVEGTLAHRYLSHLERVTTARCKPTPYDAPARGVDELAADGAVLPLTLAANRLSEGLAGPGSKTLLGRPRCREKLLDLLATLP
jgi:sirohydrochlorin ferrochelatase